MLAQLAAPTAVAAGNINNADRVAASYVAPAGGRYVFFRVALTGLSATLQVLTYVLRIDNIERERRSLTKRTAAPAAYQFDTIGVWVPGGSTVALLLRSNNAADTTVASSTTPVGETTAAEDAESAAVLRAGVPYTAINVTTGQTNIVEYEA